MKLPRVEILAAILISGCAIQQKEVSGYKLLEKTSLIGESTHAILTPAGEVMELRYTGPFAERRFRDYNGDGRVDNFQQTPFSIVRESWDLSRERDGKAFSSFFLRADREYGRRAERLMGALKPHQEQSADPQSYDRQPLGLDGQIAVPDTK